VADCLWQVDDAMGQHYVPFYYLNGVIDSTTSSIWVYEKGSDRVFSTTVGQVANENNYWPQDIEQSLANNIEAPGNVVLKKIRNRQFVTPSDKEILAKYMVTMLMRVPKGLDRMKEHAPAVLNDVFREFETAIEQLTKRYPEKAPILQKRREQLKRLRIGYESEFPREIWYRSIFPDKHPRLVELLPDMTWIFYTTDKKQPLLTSDNPFFFFESLGVGRPESEVSFPISSDVALWATWRTDLKEGFVPAKDSLIREFNRRTVSIAKRHLFYSRNEKWVVSLANKKAVRLNGIV